jgi:hypothetical protein
MLSNHLKDLILPVDLADRHLYGAYPLHHILLWVWFHNNMLLGQPAVCFQVLSVSQTHGSPPLSFSFLGFIYFTIQDSGKFTNS